METTERNKSLDRSLTLYIQFKKIKSKGYIETSNN